MTAWEARRLQPHARGRHCRLTPPRNLPNRCRHRPEVILRRPANAALLIAGTASFILMGAGQALYGPALPIYVQGFGISPATAGLLISAHWVGALAAVAGQMADIRFTARHALLLLAAGAALLAVQGLWLVMLAGAMLLGAGYGLCATIYNRRYLTEFGARGPAMVGIVNAVFGIGAIASPLLLVAVGNVPRLVFALVALLALAVLPAARPAPEGPAAGSAPLRVRPELVLAALAIGCESSNIGLGPSGLVGHAVTETAAAALASAFFVAYLISRVALYWIAPRVPAIVLLRLAILGTCVASLAASFGAAGPGYVVAGYFTGMIFPSLFVVASGAMGHSQRATSTIIAAGLVGGIVAPALLAGLLGRLGMAQFFPAMAVYAALVLLASFALIRRPA